MEKISSLLVILFIINVFTRSLLSVSALTEYGLTPLAVWRRQPCTEHVQAITLGERGEGSVAMPCGEDIDSGSGMVRGSNHPEGEEGGKRCHALWGGHRQRQWDG